MDAFTEGLRKVMLAGIGAIAVGSEKAGEIVDELVKKGEITVEQGRELNAELSRKAKEAVDDAESAALKAKLKSMTPEERAAWVERATKLAADLDAEPVEVEIEEEDGEAETPDADAEASQADAEE